MKHAYIYYYIRVGMSRYFLDKFLKCNKKTPDNVEEEGMDTYLREKRGK